jgi:predicted NAD/FAD-dependent oxidoreductase
VVVLDKGRRPGGRLATRRVDGLAFDHGAQYFTATDASFRRHVAGWLEEGVVAEWTGRIGTLEGGRVRPGSGRTTRFVGMPGMSSLPGHLARGLEIHQGVRVTSATSRAGAWVLTADDGAVFDPFDLVLVTVPGPQAVPLLAKTPALAGAAGRGRLRPCWAVLVAFDRPLEAPLDGAFVEGSPLSWVARDSAKPGRPKGEPWVLHAGPGWSEAHLEMEPQEVVPLLLAAFAEALGRDLPPPTFRHGHRWRYALPDPPLDVPCLFDPEARLGAGGDWCGGPKVQGAFRSGDALADRALALLGR